MNALRQMLSVSTKIVGATPELSALNPFQLKQIAQRLLALPLSYLLQLKRI
jgi:hypothetical protein